MKTSARVKANEFTEGLLRYETILTAQVFLWVFEKMLPPSKYLQSSGLDILSTHRMVLATQEELKGMSRDFESINVDADRFVQWANNKL